MDKVVVEVIFNPGSRAKWEHYQERPMVRERLDVSYTQGVPYRGRVARGPRFVQGGPLPPGRVPPQPKARPPGPRIPPIAAVVAPAPPPAAGPVPAADAEYRQRRLRRRQVFPRLPIALFDSLDNHLEDLLQDDSVNQQLYREILQFLELVYGTENQASLRQERQEILETALDPDLTPSRRATARLFVRMIDWRLAELQAEAPDAPGLGLGSGLVDPFATAKHDFQRRHRRFFGAYNQDRIERARPKQTLQWYADNSQILRQIKNKDFRCLEYCIVIYNKYRELKIKEWRAQGLLEFLDPLVEARNAEVKAPAKAAIAHYTRSWTRGQMVKDAIKIEEKVWGVETLEQYGDFARDVDMLVYYHNALKTRFMVFGFDESCNWCRPVARSWAMEDAIALPLNSPLITLLWTPPPPDDPNGIGHFDLIPPFVNLAVQYLNRSTQFRFCPICAVEVPIAGHPCKGPFCQLCGHWNCPGADLAQACELKECSACHGRFRGAVCLANHKKPRPSGSDTLLLQTMDMAMLGQQLPFVLKPSHPKAKTQRPMCDIRFYCACNDYKEPLPRFVEARSHRDEKKKPIRYAHRCGYHLCPHCDDHMPLGHKCCVTVKAIDKPSDPSRYVCIDIECDNRNAHRAYLVRMSLRFFCLFFCNRFVRRWVWVRRTMMAFSVATMIMVGRCHVGTR